MKVLLITQQYPPYPIVGALRARKVAEMFRARGHIVTVVTERLKGESGDVRMSDDHLVVRTVPAGLPYRLRLVAMRNRLRGRSVPLSSWDGPGGVSDDERREALGPLRRGIRALKRSIVALLRLPDDQQQFVLPPFRMSREVARNGVDLIYTTAPSFSTHLVGLLLRSGGVRWVAEFRDPWTAPYAQDKGARVPILLRINRWLERQCLAQANVVVAVTGSIGDQLAAKLPATERGKVVVAMNGIDELHPGRASDGADPLYRIAYTGSFYHDRDPAPFLNALATWMRDRRLGPGEIQVDFAGRCRHYGNVSVQHMVEDLGLADVVQFHDWLSQSAVHELLHRADLLLLLARSQPAQVPNKLFEYLGARRPILAIVDKGGESEQILSAVCGQYVAAAPEGEPVAATAIRSMLESAYNQRGDHTATDESVLEALLTERQFSRLAAALGV